MHMVEFIDFIQNMRTYSIYIWGYFSYIFRMTEFSVSLNFLFKI